MQLIRRLPHEPSSMWRATKGLGGAEWLGWTHDSTRLSDLVDLTLQNTRATATQKAKYEGVAPRPTPRSAERAVRTVKARSVAELDWGNALAN